jgi:hypothetical protein
VLATHPTRPLGQREGGMMEISENFSETTAPDLATEATLRRPPDQTRKPRRLFGRNVVAEFIAAGGGPEAREWLLRRLRTEGIRRSV